MNNLKLCSIVVMLCIIGPLLTGFIWPTGTTTETTYEVGQPVDISNDAINGKINIFSPYDDPFNNNQNVFNGTGFNNDPVSTTSSAGPVWDINTYTSITDSVTTDGDGFYTISDVGTYKNWQLLMVHAVVFYNSGDWDEIDVGTQGEVADIVIYYPDTDLLYYGSLGGVGGTDYYLLDSHEIIFSQPSDPNTTLDLSYKTYRITSYADLSKGFVVPSSSDWMNGYKNKQANILFDTGTSQQVDLIFDNPHGVNERTDVSIIVGSNGVISMECYANSSLYFQEALGSNDIYDYVLFTIDYESATISLSALRGIDSFIGDYRGAVRQTITAEWEYPYIFTSFGIDAAAGMPYWYVPLTVSNLTTANGSHNYSIDLREYNVNGSCQLNLRAVQLHSRDLSLTINSTVYSGHLDGDTFKISNGSKTFSMPINNLIVGLIGNKVYLNGDLFADPGVYVSELSISFVGDWLMSLTYYQIEEIQTTGYSWIAGGFGLDVAGFCIVGLITSFGCAAILGIYGKRSGVRLAAVAITAAFCGIIYLILLMNGL